MQNDNSYIFFYSHVERHFMSTLIGHLYILCRKHKVLLFSYGLSEKSLNILKNKNLFKNLLIVNIDKSDNNQGLLGQVKEFKANVKIFDNCFKQYHCKTLITSSDWHSLNELYLMRKAKQKKSFRISIQESVHVDTHLRKEWVALQNRKLTSNLFYSKILNNIYVSILFFLKYVFFQIIIPLFAVRLPFFTMKTIFLWSGGSGSNQSNFHLVFSEYEKNQYIKSGVNKEKLLTIAHPFTIKELKPLFDLLFPYKFKESDSILISMDLIYDHFYKNKNSYSKNEKTKDTISILKDLSIIFNEKNILIKPHPESIHFDTFPYIISELEEFENIEFLNPTIPIETFFKNVDTLVCLPPAFSSSLVFFKLFSPEKNAIAIDFYNEYLGDVFKNGEYGINYVTSLENLKSIVKDKDIKKERFNYDFQDINFFLETKK
tara:strand:+ start:14051 stop:15346 length:1296 start_codon:yes stop_codon:yes gene_type:complete